MKEVIDINEYIYIRKILTCALDYTKQMKFHWMYPMIIDRSTNVIESIIIENLPFWSSRRIGKKLLSSSIIPIHLDHDEQCLLWTEKSNLSQLVYIRKWI